jgi:predicted dehydrogenase
MGLTYAECLTRYTSGASLVAVTGGSRAPGLAARYGVSHEPSLDALLDRTDVDVIIVATPHTHHCAQVIQASSARKHVLVEKPMAISSAECDAMIEATARARVQLGVLQTARYTVPARAARELIAAGRIGDVTMLQVTWLEAGYSPATPEGENSWVSDPAEGGAFLDAGVHAFDLARWLIGAEPSHVFGRALTYVAAPLTNQSGMSQVLFANGAMATVWISFEVPLPGFPEKTMRTRIVGTRGVIDLDSYGVVQVGDADGRTTVVERAQYDMMNVTHPDRLEQYIAQTQDFVDALRAATAPPVTGADGRAAVRMVEACYRSGETGQVVRMDDILDSAGQVGNDQRL